MSPASRFAGFVTTHSKVVVAVLLVATLAVGAGAANVDGGLTIAGFTSDSPEADAYDYAQENFRTGGENTTVAQVVVRGENALSKESLLASLRFQREARATASVNQTLRDDRAFVDLASVVATAAIRAEDGANATATPPLDAQIAQLEAMTASEVETTVARVLDPDASIHGIDPYSLLPTDYTPGATTADARVVYVFQDTTGATGDGLPDAVAAAQLDLKAIAADTLPGESFVFGAGIVSEESTQATGESFAIISPVAFLLIIAVLGFAYRDVADVLYGLLGVALTLVWMFGFMGWAGIGLTQILIAVPFLLVGLSIDYALHVVMRYREARADDPSRSRREAMRRGLAGVVVAIGAATFTTAVGFLSNAVSPVGSIRDFGLVSAAGIAAAFIVFALLLPALKLELDGLLARVGLDRRASPFGRGGLAGRLLGVGATAARRSPRAILSVALVLTVAGGAVVTDIDTSTDRTDFLPRDSPEWMDSLPEAFQPSDYSLVEHAQYLQNAFVQDRAQSTAILLLRGDVTKPGTLDAIAAGRADLRDARATVTLADGRLAATGPLETIEAVAARNDTVAAVVADADTDGDGVPDRNLASVYDAIYSAAPDDAAAVIARENGDYRALRVAVSVSGSAEPETVAGGLRAVAETVESESGVSTIATGQPIVSYVVQQSVLRTLVEGFLITAGVILAFLTVIFWTRYRSLTLGAVVLAPVVAAQAWLFGTMYLAGLAYTTETAIIAAIGIGIGVDYAIHIGERFVDEYDGENAPDALSRTLTGTGGALLASAATTVAGFGVLALALVPSLQRFGFVTSVAIAYAFLASVLVLPSLLVAWTRYTDAAVAE
ncbi:RND family transporter [Salarchaeum sp. JOR-1]|uniref:efflux RND transporter permease subunit n=1 Tax=Salarchaeum sp. JOR-1 TaxID=2599399 RepID=UPI001198BC9A|nr:MMPL family transporter [Salarchaeum sp. JOR-1]QDX41070.1 MMPL family transporter [Salarchaeum sp. JOR-1]